jgi:predicted 2-oxoglutarate/Fe(II)-dependent dioxygenase YbiX/peroxiredoxin
MASRQLIRPGEAAPHFTHRSTASERYTFGSAAGRYLVLCFYGSASGEHAARALQAVVGRPDLFDDTFAAFFGVSADRDDEAQRRVASRVPGYRHFWDFDLTIASLYGAARIEDGAGRRIGQLTQTWVVLDPTLRVIATIPFRADQGDIADVLALLAAQPAPDRFAGVELMAPILYLPRVFEPALCDQLIQLYLSHGGEESGFMRDIGGKTVGVSDPAFKRRKDHYIEDQDLILTLQDRVRNCIVPEIAKVHQFQATRMERYLVACYAAEDGGHFSAHRDNTTLGTAHRRFAVSVNLNDDFDGGEVSFSEYGPRSFKAPPGGAVVFSCSLLHRVSPVTRGARFAFLPFLYDDSAAKLRERNARHLAEPEQTAATTQAPYA